MSKLLIIYYHEVVEDGEGFSYQKIEKSRFESQMKYLSDHGYHTLLFSEIEHTLPDKAVIVSFDDGFKSVYENAAPIMKKYGIKGNVYLPTKYISKDEHFMTWEMVKTLVSTNQFEMQAHTHSHVDIRCLDSKELKNEIKQMDQLFEKNIGAKTEVFCIPFGTYNRKSIKLILTTNRYKYLLGSFYGHIDTKKTDNKVLPRIGISNNDDLKKF